VAVSAGEAERRCAISNFVEIRIWRGEERWIGWEEGLLLEVLGGGIARRVFGGAGLRG
jgi:hypothetical protein